MIELAPTARRLMLAGLTAFTVISLIVFVLSKVNDKSDIADNPNISTSCIEFEKLADKYAQDVQTAKNAGDLSKEKVSAQLLVAAVTSAPEGCFPLEMVITARTILENQNTQ